ncbi:hypothetical protein CLV59_102359 [Chitinophaga dinghuensis]|uniref:Uncharacterized protein n=1 Tax=Chitinophaga dinghuensis TaxID=1539050 RepID=A0A327W7P3_9BACT|nr:hypothetical protein CLV59_102359 [Chitinophaga dinghuensis]
MRSFVALMACIGCIVWVHSCETRLLGVHVGIQPQSLSNLTASTGNSPSLPIVAVDDRSITTQGALQTEPNKLAANIKSKTKHRFTRKTTNTPNLDSSFFNAMVIKQLSYNGAILTP